MPWRALNGRTCAQCRCEAACREPCPGANLGTILGLRWGFRAGRYSASWSMSSDMRPCESHVACRNAVMGYTIGLRCLLFSPGQPFGRVEEYTTASGRPVLGFSMQNIKCVVVGDFVEEKSHQRNPTGRSTKTVLLVTCAPSCPRPALLLLHTNRAWSCVVRSACRWPVRRSDGNSRELLNSGADAG